MNCRIHISESMALASVSLRPRVDPQFQPDPLRLHLPPVGFSGGSALPDPAALRILAAMYLYAELEEAAVIPVVEVLAANRATLPVRGDAAVRKLEAFWRKTPEWYDRDHRTSLFARLFGVGVAASNDQGSLVNRDFQRALAAFCLAVLESAGATGWPVNLSRNNVHLTQAGLELLRNLGSRQFGNSLTAARQIHEQLLAALTILNDGAIQAAFSAQGLWNLLHTIIGDPAPDFTRLLHRGQDGQRILEWLAGALPQMAGAGSTLPGVTPSSPVAAWASEWLDATGILPQSNTGGVAA